MEHHPLTEAPIIFIDPDEDDQQMFLKALAELKSPHPPLVFSDGEEALAHIQSSPTVPFLILSELSLHKMDGLELRQEIEKSASLRKKSIPFIFVTYPVNEELVEQAYELAIQGLFEKEVIYSRWVDQLREILAYWTSCYQPEQFKKA